MAVNAATQWECNAATGNNANGGGFFNATPGTSVDLPAAGTVYAYTDVVINGADAMKATSSGRPFVAADAGNIFNITSSGSGWTPKRVQIASVDGSNVATVNTGETWGTVGSTGGAGNLGGALAGPTDALFDLMVAGNTLWFRTTADTGNTYTLTENLTAPTGGSATAMFTIDSYRTTRGEMLTGTARPTIDAGASAYLLWVNGFWAVKNIIFTTTAASGLYGNGANVIIDNVKATNTSGTAGRYAIQNPNGYNTVSRCEISSTNGIGMTLGLNSLVMDCYIHDCGSSYAGFLLGGAVTTIVNTIVDTCATGIDLVGYDYNTLIGNTIYHASGTTGIAGTTSNGNRFFYNIITGFTDGVKITTVYNDHLADYNNYYNNTDDRDSACVPVGVNDIDADPAFTDAANGNFTVGAAMKLSLARSAIGALGTSEVYIGAMQPVSSAGSGAGAWRTTNLGIGVA